VALQWEAHRRKREVAARGIASPDDGLHYVRRILEEHPSVAAAVATRFHELIVDEAQDTNDVQLRCIELLHATGKLKSLCLVGDFDQAIYSFNRADPRKCRQYAEAIGLERLTLVENYRSSRAICAVTHRFSTRERPDDAVGSTSDADLIPELLLFPPRQPETAVVLFRERLVDLGVPPADARVLTRSGALANKLNGRVGADLRLGVEILGAAAVARDSNRPRAGLGALEDLERLLTTLAWRGDADHTFDPNTRRLLRDEASVLLRVLPDLDQLLGTWVTQARTAVKIAVHKLTPNPAIPPQRRIALANSARDRTAREVFGSLGDDRLRAQTIHSSKGESHAAVLLVVALPHNRRPETPEWALPDGDASTSEEIRVTYVALTRARRYLALGLATNAPPELHDFFAERGFRAREAASSTAASASATQRPLPLELHEAPDLGAVRPR
jgi:DNA helicase II / ATP-dependent DNA helicase PcrA